MVNPTMPTDPIEPPYAATSSAMHWVAAEVWDHLWPWSHHGFQRQRAVQAASMALGLAASVVWVLAAMGQMEAGALIGWWFGWSAFEVVVRLGSKPYVKDGPWWGRRYRVANTMDMICYVGFKNLLIGATLFIGLKSLGLLTP
ncbi:transcription regulator [Azoarcus sp. KH32C]|uniref:transcription regulator n=1 Tax=Azoarcus sp. KH32C TaxID=748247 RepID=UPI0002386629|nr:transcription regulator [Azoarcus sp. KH32C]BAL24719.1 putative transcription regulator [Azoarcus sp. KH32C]